MNKSTYSVQSNMQAVQKMTVLDPDQQKRLKKNCATFQPGAFTGGQSVCSPP